MKRTSLDTLSADAAAKVLGVGRLKIYESVKDGKLRPLVGYEHLTFSQQSIERAKGKL